MSDYYDRDKFTGGRQNPPPPQKKPDNNTGWYTWPLIIVLFSLGIWPLALILLFYNIRNESKGKTVTVRGGAHSGGAESAVERAMRRAEDRINEASKAAVDMANRVVGSSGGRVGRVGVHSPEEMAKMLNDALDRAKKAAAKERERLAAQAQRQSQAQPVRSGYADARPQPQPQPKPQPEAKQKSQPVNANSSQRPAKPAKAKKQKLPGKGLRILGICFLVFGALLGMDFLTEVLQYSLVDFENMIMSLGFFAGGGIMFGRGNYLANITRRSQRYILAIGNVDKMSIDEIAKRVNRKPSQAAKELQKLIDKGYLGEDAYIDRERGYFLRFGATLEEDRPVEQEEFVPPPADSEEGYEIVLQNIHRANRRIADPELSRKIDRIEQVTRLIFKEVEEHPEKRDRIHTFFDYYLPTTQKLLDTYAAFEETGVEGANLRQAKARIEEAMDAIVDGFERQLDHLYSSDAMDIVTDIKVMEAMLNRDGATASRDFGYHEEEDEGGFRPLQL